MNFFFGKEFRLLNSTDFEYLRRGAFCVKTPFLRFYIKKTRINAQKHARLGLSISKKSGGAVYRNIIKRKIREGFRRSLVKELPLDILVTASPQLKKFSREKIVDSIEVSLEKGMGRSSKIMQKWNEKFFK